MLGHNAMHGYDGKGEGVGEGYAPCQVNLDIPSTITIIPKKKSNASAVRNSGP